MTLNNHTKGVRNTTAIEEGNVTPAKAGVYWCFLDAATTRSMTGGGVLHPAFRIASPVIASAAKQSRANSTGGSARNDSGVALAMMAEH